MATYSKFNIFVQDIAEAVHDFSAAAEMALYLTNVTPLSSHIVKATNPVEIATGSGYAGPFTLTTPTSTLNGAAWEFKADDADPMVTATGNVAQFQYVVLFNLGTVAKVDPLVGWWDYGSAIDLVNGETFSVVWTDAANIIVTIT